MHAFSPILIIAYSLMGLISAYFAKKKGRNPYFWFSMGVCFGVLTLITLFLLNIKSVKEPVKPKKTVIEDSKLWYYLKDEKQLGPVSLNKLSLLLKEGEISSNDLVWNETLDTWKILNETIEYHLLLKEKSIS